MKKTMLTVVLIACSFAACEKGSVDKPTDCLAAYAQICESAANQINALNAQVINGTLSPQQVNQHINQIDASANQQAHSTPCQGEGWTDLPTNY